MRIVFVLFLSGTFQLIYTQTTFIIDANHTKTLISPYIFGRNNNLNLTATSNWTLNPQDEIRIKDAGVRFMREGGGNNSTKYNWRLKLQSHPDWYNNVYANDWDQQAQYMLDHFPGVYGMWSFQLIGKVASNNKNNFDDWGYNRSTWWTGTAQNLAGGGQPNTNGGASARVEGNPTLYLIDWPADSTTQILKHWFDKNDLALDPTRLVYWSMDNEPEIWSSTHDDIIKTQTADEFINKYIQVAKAARAQYPSIKLTGPVTANEWQWYNWDNNAIQYNGKAYTWIEYFIKCISEEQQKSGIRLLDVVDLHFYPGTSKPDELLQLYKVMFDRNYVFPEANGLHRLRAVGM